MNRNRILIFIFYLIFFYFDVIGQTTFQKTYGGNDGSRGYDVQLTSDGGLIIVGNRIESNQVDIFLVKTDSIGDTLWTKTYGGSSSDVGYSVKQTFDGGFILTGFTYSLGVNSETFLIKTDANGNTNWVKTFSTISHNSGVSLLQTSDSGFVILGNLNDTSIYLIKTNSDGDTIWTKEYANDYISGNAIKQTSDGGFIIAGAIDSSSSGIFHVLLIKVDYFGNILWSKIHDAGGESASSILQSFDNGFIITGSNSHSGNFGDVFLTKTDSIGDIVWSRTFGGATAFDIGYSVIQTKDTGYIVCGFTNNFGNGIYVIKTDSNGDTLWTKTYGGNGGEIGYGVVQSNDGGYYFIGQTNSFSNPIGPYHIYLVRTKENGVSSCYESNTGTIVNSPLTQVRSININTFPTNITLSQPSFTIGSGGSTPTLCISTGTEEIQKNNSIRIAPNPATNHFKIFFDELIKKGNVQILNTIGENVITKIIYNESMKEINLNNISRGIYFVKVFNGEKSLCKKLIIE